VFLSSNNIPLEKKLRIQFFHSFLVYVFTYLCFFKEFLYIYVVMCVCVCRIYFDKKFKGLDESSRLFGSE